jgi:hypothetical protein
MMRARALTLVHSEPRAPAAIRLIGWARSLVLLALLVVVAFVVVHRVVFHRSNAHRCCGIASQAP